MKNFFKYFLMRKNVFSNLRRINRSRRQNCECYGTFATEDSVILPKHPRIIIVGGGISGLSAANFLIDNGLKNILIVEAAERCGGRIYSVPFGDAVCELGAKWIYPSNSPLSLFEYAKSMGFKNAMIEGSQEEKFYSSMNGETINSNAVQLGVWTFHTLLNNIHESMKNYSNESCEHYLKFESSEMNKKLFNNSEIVTQVFTSLFKDLCSSLGCDLSNVGVIHLAKAARVFSQSIHISQGLGEVVEKLAGAIKKNHVQTGKPVQSIRWSNLMPEERPYVSCVDGTKYEADHIICTLPLGNMKSFAGIAFTPKLPADKIEAITKLGVGHPLKIYFEYTKPVFSWFTGTLKPIWDPKHFQGQVDWASDISEIAIVYGSKRVLEIKVGSRLNEDLERCNDKIIVDTLTSLLRRVLKNKDIPLPNSILRSSWSNNPLFLGGSSYLSLLANESIVDSISAPLSAHKWTRTPVLLFAGEATSFDGFGTIEGARQSGIREAKRIIACNTLL